MLETGKFYHLKLLAPWDKEFEVAIVGVTTRDHLSNFGTFDIRGTYFDPYGFGLGEYINLIADETPIYIVKRIETRSPISLEVRVKIVIPAPLVDEKNSEELLACSEIEFVTGGVTRFFTGPLGQLEFLQETAKNLIGASNYVDNVVGDNLTIDYNIVEALYEKSLIEKAVVRRAEMLKEVRSSSLYQAIEREQHDRNLILKSKELDEQIAIEKAAQVSLAQQYIAMTTALASANSFATQLDRVRQIMIGMIDKIKSGELSMADFPSFADLYAQAESELSNGD